MPAWAAFYPEAAHRSDAVAAAARSTTVRHGSGDEFRVEIVRPQQEAVSDMLVFIHGGGFVEGTRYPGRATSQPPVQCDIGSAGVSPAPGRRAVESRERWRGRSRGG